MQKCKYGKIAAIVGAAAIRMSAYADITVKLNPNVDLKEVNVEYGYISDMAKPRNERPEPKQEQIKVENGKATIKTLNDGNGQYVIPTSDREYIVVYTHPDDNLTVNLESISPLSYSVSGSRLMADISSLDNESSKLIQDYRALMASGNQSAEDIDKINAAYNKIFTDYIAADPDAEGVPYAIMHLEGEDFLNAYEAMTPKAKESAIAILLEPQKAYVEKRVAAEKHAQELQSGRVEAPNFTFNDVNGQAVSLSDYRGKWVIIDFWGTWCPWCIKGFPSLKKAYAEKKDQLEVIGVACNDKYDTWKASLTKYELPWVNVYNPDKNGGKILEEYAVDGFPTKVIVTPEGKIANITAGDDPSFYTILDELMKK